MSMDSSPSDTQAEILNDIFRQSKEQERRDRMRSSHSRSRRKVYNTRRHGRSGYHHVRDRCYDYRGHEVSRHHRDRGHRANRGYRDHRNRHLDPEYPHDEDDTPLSDPPPYALCGPSGYSPTGSSSSGRSRLFKRRNLTLGRYRPRYHPLGGGGAGGGEYSSSGRSDTYSSHHRGYDREQNREQDRAHERDYHQEYDREHGRGQDRKHHQEHGREYGHEYDRGHNRAHDDREHHQHDREHHQHDREHHQHNREHHQHDREHHQHDRQHHWEHDERHARFRDPHSQGHDQEESTRPSTSATGSGEQNSTNQNANQNTNNQKKRRTPRYFMPREIPVDRIDKEELVEAVLRVVKFVLYGVLCAAVLGLVVASKLTLLVMTAQVRTDGGTQERISPVIAYQNKVITCLMICLCFPHALTLVMNFFKALFGGKEWPNIYILICVIIQDSIYAIGLCFLVYKVLPKLDMVRGLLLLNCVCIAPGLLKLLAAKCPRWAPTGAPGKDTTNEQNAGEQQRKQSNAARRESVPYSTASKQNRRQQEHEILDMGRDQVEETGSNPLVLPWKLCTALAWLAQVGVVVYIALGTGVETRRVTGPKSQQDSRFVRMVTQDDERRMFSEYWQLVVALVCVSIKWWENFVDRDFGELKLQTWKEAIHEKRDKFAWVGSVFCMAIIVLFPFVMVEDFEFRMFNQREAVWKNIAPPIIQSLSGVTCYVLALAACMLKMQLFCVNIPLFLSTPASIAVVLTHCIVGIPRLGPYFTVCPEFVSVHGESFVWSSLDSATWLQLGVFMGGWLALFIIGGHIWFPRQNTMDIAEKLFINPLYCGPLLGESLVLNRRRRDKEVAYSSKGFHWVNLNNYYLYPPPAPIKSQQTDDNPQRSSPERDRSPPSTPSPRTPVDTTGDSACDSAATDDSEDDIVPTIHACATLWHETVTEMEQLLKSIFRLDKHHFARQILLKGNNPNLYKIEVHIFFDDAFVYDKKKKGKVPNEYVELFYKSVHKAGSSVHEYPLTFQKPQKIKTPYGGRLVYTLPGDTMLYVHLKDKERIRHKKRWSQVMYMYYLLGYQLLELHGQKIKDDDEGMADFFYSRKKFFSRLPKKLVLKAENTFILALDGDVDFKPNSLGYLMDLMKKNKNVGGACGRIHPIGSGPIVWYQQFEYAIAHWLQKSAEHVLGCVLCSPGCFSLFRGSALMDDNVMKTYTKKSEEALHHVQYDQGEDRWLCTLLLQAGYKVEYVAAADALTYCPDTFSGLFIQRRRWTPSTMANTVDLISTADSTVANNNNISIMYMFYQMFLFATSIMAPGTILLSIAGVFRIILSTGFVASYILAVQPAAFYVMICMTTKEATQLRVAMVLSAFYAVVMTVTIIGTVVTYAMGSGLSPNLVFFIGLITFFVLAAALHPLEWTCLLPAPIFFLCAPTGYLLLIIFAVCNMDNVNWGTREATVVKTEEEEQKEREEEQRKAKEAKKNKGILNMLGINKIISELKDFFTGLKATNTNTSRGEVTDMQMEILQEMRTTNELLQGRIPSRCNSSIRRMRRPTLTQGAIKSTTHNGQPKKNDSNCNSTQKSEHSSKGDAQKKEETLEHVWFNENFLGHGAVESLHPREIIFWNDLIEELLKPIEKDEKKEKKVKADLKDLRTFVTLGFCIVNFLWIVIIFLLQYLGEDDSVKRRVYIPIGIFGKTERFEPFGLLFLLFFSLIMVLQFLAMLVHRFNTLLHLLAVTEIFKDKKNIDIKLFEETCKLDDRYEDDAQMTDEPRAGDKNNDLSSMLTSQVVRQISQYPGAYHRQYYDSRYRHHPHSRQHHQQQGSEDDGYHGNGLRLRRTPWQEMNNHIDVSGGGLLRRQVTVQARLAWEREQRHRKKHDRHTERYRR